MADPLMPAATPPGPMSLNGRFPMVRLMAQGWWMFILRGAASILFGLLAFLVPGLGLAVMLGFLAAWMALDGIGTLYQAVKGPPERHGAWFWVDGIVSLGAAAALLLAPVASALVLVLITGIWSIAIGVLRLVLAFRLGSVLMGLAGAIAVFIGAWLVAAPGPGLLALIWVVGIQALVAGALLCWLGWRLRRVAHDPHGPALGRG
ncbi:DUF308 domain-containing protein [Paeniroseomonas aquatica]|jgi:uncharacterized membrane protein HdeD (DUF308 family)|uniref:DUF308 domain-containing protein n=1 Tax=Paeniroseomonas aquatica TaxID=373043 RepID=A0ABT8AFA4_9PROT|nr:DUF308 domain-containing protein [Paeniroseomonas aquatica]MDN3568034.1 DUF308 domain-containing protein [Paeniroseomonas aquatica]